MAQADTFNFAGLSKAKPADAPPPGQSNTDTASSGGADAGGLNFGGLTKSTTPPPAAETLEQRGARIRQESLKRRQAHEAQRQQGQEPVLQALMGAGHGALSTVQSLASPIRKVFGMPPAAPPPAETTTAGAVGRGMEQVGEFYVPAAIATKYGRVLNAASKLRAAGLGPAAAKLLGTLPEAVMQYIGADVLTRVQGGSNPKTAGAIAAASPVVSAAAELAVPKIVSSAKAGIARVLRPGLTAKELDSPEAPRLVAQAASTAFDQGLEASWKGWRSLTALGRRKAGQTLQTVLESPVGDQLVPVQPVLDAIDDFVDQTAKHLVVGPGTANVGTVIRPTPQAKVALQTARSLRRGIAAYGPNMTVRQLHDLKQAWDIGVFGGKEAGAPVTYLADRLVKVDAAMQKVAADGVRQVLESHAPDVAALDQVTSKAIKLNQMVKRAARASAGPDAVERVVKKVAAGAVTGSLAGTAGYKQGGWMEGTVAALAGTALGSQLDVVFRSPGWKLIPAATKKVLADAIASGQVDRIRTALTPVLSAVSSGRQAAPQASTAPPSATPTAAPAPQ